MEPTNILLIEDNPGDVELTRQSFSSSIIQNSLEVVMDGQQALDYLFQKGIYNNQRLPDIILLDLNLPKVNGRQILEKLKKDCIRNSIPIIILSSSENARDIQESYSLHANCFVTKPVQLNEFTKVLQMIEMFWINIVHLPIKGKKE